MINVNFINKRELAHLSDVSNRANNLVNYGQNLVLMSEMAILLWASSLSAILRPHDLWHVLTKETKLGTLSHEYMATHTARERSLVCSCDRTNESTNGSRRRNSRMTYFNQTNRAPGH